MVKVERAIIPAAGLSTRMFPYTKEINKLMLPIADKPMIHYLIDELTSSGIKEVIITGRHINEIKDYFTYDPELMHIIYDLKDEDAVKNILSIKAKCKIIYIANEIPKGWPYEVYLARDILKQGPFVVSFSDILYDSKVPAAKQLIKEYQKTQLNMTSDGRFVLDGDLVPLTEKLSFKVGDPGKENEKQFHQWIRNKGSLKYNIKGDKFDTGDELSYLKTITHFSIKDKRIKDNYRAYLTELLKKL